MREATRTLIKRLSEVPALRRAYSERCSVDPGFVEEAALYAEDAVLGEAGFPPDVRQLLDILEELLATRDPKGVRVPDHFLDVLEHRYKQRKPIGRDADMADPYTRLRASMGGRLRRHAQRRSARMFVTIDTKTWLSRFIPLRRATPSTDRAEIRVWVGSSRQALEGVVIRRCGVRLIGWHLPRVPWFCMWHPRKKLHPPGGWTSLWEGLEEGGAFELPDCSVTDGHRAVWHGKHYVVECLYRGAYRSYTYADPTCQVNPEARRFGRLLELLRSETGFDVKRESA